MTNIPKGWKAAPFIGDDTALGVGPESIEPMIDAATKYVVRTMGHYSTGDRRFAIGLYNAMLSHAPAAPASSCAGEKDLAPEAAFEQAWVMAFHDPKHSKRCQNKHDARFWFLGAIEWMKAAPAHGWIGPFKIAVMPWIQNDTILVSPDFNKLDPNGMMPESERVNYRALIRLERESEVG